MAKRLTPVVMAVYRRTQNSVLTGQESLNTLLNSIKDCQLRVLAVEGGDYIVTFIVISGPRDGMRMCAPCSLFTDEFFEFVR